MFHAASFTLPPSCVAISCSSCSAVHASRKTIKWKKSGSAQLRDMSSYGTGSQLMSQFAVARHTRDNQKAYSARVSCIVKDGITQGVFIVQVRPSTDRE